MISFGYFLGKLIVFRYLRNIANPANHIVQTIQETMNLTCHVLLPGGTVAGEGHAAG